MFTSNVEICFCFSVTSIILDRKAIDKQGSVMFYSCLIALAICLAWFFRHHRWIKIIVKHSLLSKIQSINISEGKILLLESRGMLTENYLGYSLKPALFPGSSASFPFCQRVNQKMKEYPGNQVEDKNKITVSINLGPLKWLGNILNSLSIWFFCPEGQTFYSKDKHSTV